MNKPFYFQSEPLGVNPEVALAPEQFEWAPESFAWEAEESEAERGSSAYVRWVQQALNQAQGLRLAVNGIAGRATRSAIRSFQRREGLPIDGRVGLATERVLIARTATAPPTEAEQLEAETGTPKGLVNPARVSCAKRDRRLPIFKAMGTNDPVAVIEAASRRAVVMLDNVLAELKRIQARVRAGAPPAWPLIGDLLGWSLETRMLMRARDPRAWTGKGPRTAEQIIRWLTNIRKLIADGHLSYNCLDATATPGCGPRTWAWVFLSGPNSYRIHLCRAFWRPKPKPKTKSAAKHAADHLDFQAQTIIHEVSHIYYKTNADTPIEGRGRGPGHAECISQFVADANGSPLDDDFVGLCGPREPARS